MGTYGPQNDRPWSAPPGIGLIVAITALFGLFGLIPASIRADRARTMGHSSGRYWKAFGITYGSLLALQILAIIVAAAIFMSAATSQNATPVAPGPVPSPSVQEPVKTLRVGVKFDQPGLGQRTTGGTYEGFDIDVARYLATELGYTDITFVEAPSSMREMLLQNRNVDLVIATYAISEPRKQKVSFAGPYLITGQDLLVRRDSTISGPGALNGRQLCSVIGSTSAKRVQDSYAPAVRIVEMDTYPDCVKALGSGTVDAVTTDGALLAGWAAEPQFAGQLKVVGAPFTTEKYGIGIPKGDTPLCARINAALTKMATSGAWGQAYAKSFGPAGVRTPQPPTPEPCS